MLFSIQSIGVFLFYFFSAIILFSGFFAVTSKKSVHSVLLLVLTFFGSAWIFILQKADFIAMILIIIYVGAIAILFLFVVMMLEEPNKKIKHIKHGKVNILFSLTVGIILFFELFAIILTSNIHKAHNQFEGFNIKDIGNIIYTQYFVEFQITGFLFFVSMVGAIVLAFKKEDITGKKQSISSQINRENKIILAKPEIRKGIKI